MSNSVLQELRSSIPPGGEVDARGLLGRFLFSGDDADKPVAVLSGGERTRLALAKLLVSPVNFLCMDEPTNHLDMWSRDVLEEALQEYGGAIVLITHDRHLIRNVANRIVEVVDGRVTAFEGDYDYYLAKRDPRPEDVPPPARPAPAPTLAAGPKSKDQKRAEAQERARTKSLRDRVARIERDLETLGAELVCIESEFADPAFYSSGADVAETTQRYERAKRRRSVLEVEWAALVEEMESDRAG